MMKAIRMLLCAMVAVSGSAMAAYAPGTIITPNPLQPTKQLLVLEHSLVDLARGIEILNFDYTLGKSACDVYKGLTGEYLTIRSSCLDSKTVYTDAAVTAQDGWRIGVSANLVDVVRMYTGWYEAASWLTIFNGNRTAMELIAATLGMTRTAPVGGVQQASFQVVVGDNFYATGPYTQYVYALDEINYSSGDTGYRVSQAGSHSEILPTSAVLLVRDWTGEPRAINSASAVPGVVGGLFAIGMLMAGFFRRSGRQAGGV